MHWHAYRWTGAGAERGDDAVRRPDSPDFRTSPLPPMLTGDWLAKPASRIAASFDDAEAAVSWLAAAYGEIRGLLPVPAADPVPLPDREPRAPGRVGTGGTGEPGDRTGWHRSPAGPLPPGAVVQAAHHRPIAPPAAVRRAGGAENARSDWFL